MNELKIEYVGGYRQVSKYLILQHDANFAVIIDSLVNIHNMNITKLVEIGGELSVKISNGFLSRHTGLGISIIKANVKKIEDLGLITAIKKGQGNTRHYTVNIENINTYIAALQPKFDQWYKKSLESSKKDKARSDHDDLAKLKKSQKNFDEAIASITSTNEKSIIGLVENRPTKPFKTDQPNRVKPTVVETTIETTIETTTGKKNVVVKRSTTKTPTLQNQFTGKKLTEPANKETSDTNWNRLEQAYNSLPTIPSQGRFFTSAQDKLNFFALSVAMQEYVIKSVVAMKDCNTTASRPATYINEAMKPKPKRIYEPNKRLNVCL